MEMLKKTVASWRHAVKRETYNVFRAAWSGWLNETRSGSRRRQM